MAERDSSIAGLGGIVSLPFQELGQLRSPQPNEPIVIFAKLNVIANQQPDLFAKLTEKQSNVVKPCIHAD